MLELRLKFLILCLQILLLLLRISPLCILLLHSRLYVLLLLLSTFSLALDLIYPKLPFLDLLFQFGSLIAKLLDCFIMPLLCVSCFSFKIPNLVLSVSQLLSQSFHLQLQGHNLVILTLVLVTYLIDFSAQLFVLFSQLVNGTLLL